ncbi:MAG: mRNA surveillance protein pelota [Methanobacteriaceae archaeon]|nr:mRNA surveillance protein pelota [Methanobacteriaceae archaeon]
MHIKKQDKKKGLIELIPESQDDLWHLSHIIQKNNYVSSLTTRRIQDPTGDKIRSDRGIKKTFFLGLRVKEIKYHKYTGMLRLTGIIESGPEDIIPLGAHHTLNIQENNTIRIQKTWDKWSLKRLEEAINATKKPTQIIIALEDNTTDIGIIRQYGIDYIGPIQGELSGKQEIQKNRKEKQIEYFTEITNVIQKYKKINKLIIIGPGFTKNSYYEYLQNKHQDLAKKSIIENTGSGGHTGIQEILKTGIIKELTKEARIAKEIKEVNDLLALIGKSSNLIAYSQKETKKAINMGAVEKLLVLDKLLRNREITELMNTVENMGGKVTIISNDHDGGQQLKALGSMAAFLRYPIN